ncbi:MAG: hypothetical protein COA79_25110 [Planctomycetota bacterium]|nr:MAG: hypothetical protein COA79_25110 [Planctomycetota bacterium]
MNKQSIYLISFLFLIGISNLIAEDDEPNINLIWGPFYRNSTFLPVNVSVSGKFRPYIIKNNISQDDLSYQNETTSSALILMSSSSTLIELINPNTNKKKLINLPLQVLNQETMLIGILGEEQKEIKIKSKNTKVFETNLLPESISGYQMIDLLIITKDFPTISSSNKTEALKNWVYKGGTVIFDSIDCLRNQGPLTVHLFKQLAQNPKEFDSLTEKEKKKIIGDIVREMASNSSIKPLLFGNVSIFTAFNRNEISKTLERFEHHIKWSKLNRYNSILDDNKLSDVISKRKTSHSIYYIIIYFLIFMTISLLKPKKTLIGIASLIAIASIIPAIYFSPTNQINGYVYQMIEGSNTNKYTKIKKEILLQKGNIEKIEFELQHNIPMVPINDSQIILHKNKMGQYVKQEIRYKGQYLKLKSENIFSNKYFVFQHTKNQDLLFHKQPINNGFDVNEETVTLLTTHKIKTYNAGIISKIQPEKKSFKRDDMEHLPWYPLSNQYFYEEPPRSKNIKVFNGKLDSINLKPSPSFNFERTEFSLIIKQ